MISLCGLILFLDLEFIARHGNGRSGLLRSVSGSLGRGDM